MASQIEISDKPFLQLVLILGFCFVSTVLFSIVGMVLTVVIFDIDLTSFYNYADPNVIEGLKMFQLLSAIGLFLVPPLLYGLFTTQKLDIKTGGKPTNYLLMLVLMVVSTPFISWIIELNANMVLPDFLSGVEQWMRSSETQAEELTKAFLTFDGIRSLFYVLIIVAVVPALGEELLFRGVLQKIFIKWFKNPHIGIWVTSILFSALHMQFFGFFPRLLLGLLFGYIFFWSKSLWIPILGHFINNGSVVVMSYFYPEMVDDADISFFSEGENNIVFYLGSLIVSGGILYLIRRINQNNKPITV